MHQTQYSTSNIGVSNAELANIFCNPSEKVQENEKYDWNIRNVIDIGCFYLKLVVVVEQLSSSQRIKDEAKCTRCIVQMILHPSKVKTKSQKLDSRQTVTQTYKLHNLQCLHYLGLGSQPFLELETYAQLSPSSW